MKKTAIRMKWLAAVSIAALLAGCGAASASSAAAGNYQAAAAEDTAAYREESAYEGDYGAGEADAAAEAERKAENSTAAPEAPEDASGEQGLLKEDKLIYRCYLRLETLQYAETLASVREKVKAAQGVIENESESDSDSEWYYTDHVRRRGTKYMSLTVRIPTEQYETFLASLEGQGKIVEKNSSVENISRQYYDTQAVIESLEIQEERLLQMMQEAETVEDMLAIEDRLTDVQTELNQYRTHLASMDTDVRYSTVTLDIREVAEYSPDTDPVKQATFADRLKNALKGSWAFFRSLLENLLFALIYIFPVALAAGLIALIVRLILKKTAPAREAKRKKKAEEREARRHKMQNRRPPYPPQYGNGGPGMPPPPAAPGSAQESGGPSGK